MPFDIQFDPRIGGAHGPIPINRWGQPVDGAGAELADPTAAYAPNFAHLATVPGEDLAEARRVKRVLHILAGQAYDNGSRWLWEQPEIAELQAQGVDLR